MTTEEQNFPWDLKNLPQAGIGNGPTALVAGIDPDPRETLRAIREQLQIEQVGTKTYIGYEVGTDTKTRWAHIQIQDMRWAQIYIEDKSWAQTQI